MLEAIRKPLSGLWQWIETILSYGVPTYMYVSFPGNFRRGSQLALVYYTDYWVAGQCVKCWARRTISRLDFRVCAESLCIVTQYTRA